MKQLYCRAPQNVKITPFNPNVVDFSAITHWGNYLPSAFAASGNPKKGMWESTTRSRAGKNAALHIDASYISTIAMAFDIETTSIMSNEECRGYMYIWHFAVEDLVVRGRTWDEFIDFTNVLVKHYHLGERTMKRPDGTDKKCFYEARIWIANLSFEFNFFHRYFDFAKNGVFAKKMKQPITASTVSGLLFQDALALTNTSLAKIPKIYNLPTQKLKGDLDYSKIRNTATPLVSWVDADGNTRSESDYCINDVGVLIEFSRTLKAMYTDNGYSIPTTATSFLRKDVKALYDYDMHLNDKQYDRNATVNFMKLFPQTLGEFELVQNRLFRGGYTHTNVIHTGRTFTEADHVNGVDFTSSYPAVILQKDYPMAPFTPYIFNSIDEIINSGRPVYGKFVFHKLRATTSHSIESYSKLSEYIDNNSNLNRAMADCGKLILDNGKIRYAHKATMYLTDVDLRLFKLYYEWDSVEIYDTKVSEYGRLPHYLLFMVIYYYSKKQNLKAQGRDGTTEYKLAKAMVNAAYGMMCEHLHVVDNIKYSDGNWFETDRPTSDQAAQEAFEKEVFGDVTAINNGYKAPKKCLSPYWGVWVTAYARENLLNMVWQINEDVIYCDTDSIYMCNFDKHIDKITSWNLYIEQLNNWWIDNKYNNVYQDKADINVFRDLGAFDRLLGSDKDTTPQYYTRFKALGAKRYLKEAWHGNTLEVEQTIAGLPKTSLTKYASIIGKDPFEIFEDKLTIPAEFVGKNAHTYNEKTHSDTITDYMGNTVQMQELSSIGIYPIGFSLSMTSDYLTLIAAFAEEHKNKYYHEP